VGSSVSFDAFGIKILSSEIIFFGSHSYRYAESKFSINYTFREHIRLLQSNSVKNRPIGFFGLP